MLLVALVLCLVLAAVALRVAVVVHQAFAPAEAAEPGRVDPTRLEHLDSRQRQRAALSCVRDAHYALSAGQGELDQALRDLWKMALGVGMPRTEHRLLEASSYTLYARHCLQLAVDYDPHTGVDVDGFDPDVTRPSERLRRRSPGLWIGLALCPRGVRGTLDWWLGIGQISEARRQVAELRAQAGDRLRAAPQRIETRPSLAERIPHPAGEVRAIAA